MVATLKTYSAGDLPAYASSDGATGLRILQTACMEVDEMVAGQRLHYYSIWLQLTGTPGSVRGGDFTATIEYDHGPQTILRRSWAASAYPGRTQWVVWENTDTFGWIVYPPPPQPTDDYTIWDPSTIQGLGGWNQNPTYPNLPYTLGRLSLPNPDFGIDNVKIEFVPASPYGQPGGTLGELE